MKYEAVLLRNSVQLGLVLKPETGWPYGKLDAAEYASCSEKESPQIMHYAEVMHLHLQIFRKAKRPGDF